MTNIENMPDPPSLVISSDKVCFIIIKGREFDVKDGVSEPNPGSNATDDDMRAVLEDHANDPVQRELIGFIQALNEDEQIDLVALAWLGRGEDDITAWDTIRAEAARSHNNRTAAYLLGMPQLPDFLEEGLSAFGESCEDAETAHL
jgi:Protein of unknown function (DUF3775)